jgi:hypothetical protein
MCGDTRTRFQFAGRINDCFVDIRGVHKSGVVLSEAGHEVAQLADDDGHRRRAKAVSD